MIERAAIVTGAANGLGLPCAERLAADGVAVTAVDVDTGRLEAVVDRLGPDARAAFCDIRDRDGCARVVAETVERCGGLAVVVNAAGVYPRRPLLEISADDWRHVFEVNVLGTYNMAVEAIAAMRDRGGHIVNISSIDGFTAHPDNAHYAATKAAVISLTRSLALEVAPFGIRVNSVAPGPMATDRAVRTDWYDAMVDALPTRQPIEPAEVADLVAYLSSPANVSIAGENIIISGGGLIA